MLDDINSDGIYLWQEDSCCLTLKDIQLLTLSFGHEPPDQLRMRFISFFFSQISNVLLLKKNNKILKIYYVRKRLYKKISINRIGHRTEIITNFLQCQRINNYYELI